jgi:hypothetical protein
MGACDLYRQQNRSNNTTSVRDSYITYAFKAVAPPYKGLCMINASFSGRPNAQLVANFSVIVTDDLQILPSQAPLPFC